MGYLLAFARGMAATARKNQLNLQQVFLQTKQNRITQNLSMLEMMASQISKADKESPNLKYIEFQKEILLAMSNNLELRMKLLQTQIQQATAEEEATFGKDGNGLVGQIQAAAPKYQ